MAVIIELPKTKTRQHKLPLQRDKRSAEILFFSGVRYCRNEDDATMPVKVAKQRLKRSK